jgi:hypothetical protein
MPRIIAIAMTTHVYLVGAVASHYNHSCVFHVVAGGCDGAGASVFCLVSPLTTIRVAVAGCVGRGGAIANHSPSCVFRMLLLVPVVVVPLSTARAPCNCQSLGCCCWCCR